MRTDVPISQVFDAYELESKGIREFYKIEFLTEDDATLYLTPHDRIDWLGHTWEFLPCKLTDNSQNSSGEQSRPKLAAVNPEGIFSLWVESGKVDGALVTRYRTLLTDLEAGVAAYTKAVWVISKVLNLNKEMVTFELRSTIDGAHYMLPARSFYPPEFPHVSLR